MSPSVGESRLIFVNRFFYPDHSATSQILGDLAFHLAEQGVCVHVIASRQLYDNAGADLSARESARGVQIHRVATMRFGRHSLLGRAMDYLSFYPAAAWRLLRVARRGDVVVAKTDPPMLSVLAGVLATLRGFKVVNWLQDLYPEVAAELGVSGLDGAFGRFLVGIRNASLKRAERNVAIGEDMARRLRTLGLPAGNLDVIANWTDDISIVPIAPQLNPLRAQWSLEEKFIVAYSGNLGRAHDVDTVLGAAEKLQARTDVTFLFIGGGRQLAELEIEVTKRGLTNVLFEPYQPRELLCQSLTIADVHWLSLREGLDGLILPSKFYGIAAAGRPIIVIGSAGGELARLVAEFDCGFHVELGQSDDFACAVLALADDSARCRRLGANARLMLDERFTKKAALHQWHTLIATVATETPA